MVEFQHILAAASASLVFCGLLFTLARWYQRQPGLSARKSDSPSFR